MTIPVQIVAAEIRRRLPDVPTKKLHKLLYYAQGHHLAAFGVSLFSESISAWDMGPVVGELWYAEKQNGPADPTLGSHDEAVLNTVGRVVSAYGGLTGLELERLTHTEQPWQSADARRLETGVRTAPISVESILHYFNAQMSDAEISIRKLDADAVKSWLDGAPGRVRSAASPDTFESLAARRR